MNIHTAKSLATDLPDSAAGVDLLLVAGGDERILPDPATRRNRYGTMAAPSRGEIFLSSSTASTITPRAHRAAEIAWTALSANCGDDQGIGVWFERLRARLLDLFGIAGCAVVLTGSGTEAELTALAIANNVLGAPLTNIVIAPSETGSGVLRAAGGAHFLGSTPFGEGRLAGDPLSGWAGADIEAATIEIRNPRGDLRPAVDIDAEARLRVGAEIEAGRNVLLHLLQTSKTGRSGVTVGVASQLLAEAPDRVMIVADCCQLRCSREYVRQLLGRGFIVAITGSKFFAGPPFSGALLLPPQILGRIGRLALPAGLADYSSRLDWPSELQAKVRLRWANEANLGLGLRWVAALDEMERFFAAPDGLCSAVLASFAGEVRKRAKRVENLYEISDEPVASPREPGSILSFVMSHADGAPFSRAETAAVHARMRAPCAGPSANDRVLQQIFHLGQPVAIGPRTALRVCASAPMISEIAERVSGGENIDAAFAQWGRNLDAVFDKWSWLIGETCALRCAALAISGAHERRR